VILDIHYLSEIHWTEELEYRISIPKVVFLLFREPIQRFFTFSCTLTRIPIQYQESFADEVYVKTVRTSEVNTGLDAYRFIRIYFFFSTTSFTVEQ